MSYLLDQLETKILEHLNPLIDESDGLKGIETQAFDTAENIIELLAKFQNRMPGAFLSVPFVQFGSGSPVRAMDFDANYQFLVGSASLADTPVKTTEVAKYFDKFCLEFFLKEFAARGELPATIDYVKPTFFAYSQVSPTLSATLFSFKIGVRNWRLRDTT